MGCAPKQQHGSGHMGEIWPILHQVREDHHHVLPPSDNSAPKLTRSTDGGVTSADVVQ